MYIVYSVMFIEKSSPVTEVKFFMLCNLYPIRTSIMYQSIIMYIICIIML